MTVELYSVICVNSRLLEVVPKGRIERPIDAYKATVIPFNYMGIGSGVWESNPVSCGYEPQMVYPFHSPGMSGAIRGNRTLVICLEGRGISHYTTTALKGVAELSSFDLNLSPVLGAPS